MAAVFLFWIFSASSVFSADTFEDRFAQKLNRLVSINSGSHNKEGLDRVAAELKKIFEELGFQTQWNYESRNFTATKIPAGAKKTFLLVAHMDTVFEPFHPFQTMEAVPDANKKNIFKGPGVSDNKGGIVLIEELIRSFQGTEEEKQIGWKICIQADEETGSKYSQKAVVEFARDADATLVFEPGWFDGKLKKPFTPASSGGILHLEWKVQGVEAHSGIAYDEGRSAVAALARHILFFESLTDKKRELLVNVAVIQGGTKLNVRPGEASFRASIRFRYAEDEKRFETQVQKARTRFEKDGIKISYELKMVSRPQQIADPQLLKELQAAASAMGQPAPQPGVSMARSASILFAAAGIPVLDGMGPYGGHIHSDKEVIYLDSVKARLDLSKALLTRLLKR